MVHFAVLKFKVIIKKPRKTVLKGTETFTCTGFKLLLEEREREGVRYMYFNQVAETKTHNCYFLGWMLKLIPVGNIFSTLVTNFSKMTGLVRYFGMTGTGANLNF